MRPKERSAMINEQIDNALAQRKEMDHHLEDQVDVGVHRFVNNFLSDCLLFRTPISLRMLHIALVYLPGLHLRCSPKR